MTQADTDDLVGTIPDPVRQRLAERRSSRLSDAAFDAAVRQRSMGVNPKTGGPIVEDMMAGVTVSWLSQVFGMDPKTVKAKLADCPPLHRRKAGYVYSLPVACQYLVKPALSAEQFMKSIKQSDLPASMQQVFWDAALKRQKWEENAGQLWRTEKVREVLGTTFQTIKFTLQLWPDTIERQKGLTQEQRELLIKLVDELQAEIHKSLIKEATKKHVGSQKSELPEMTGERPDQDHDEDDDWENLV